jgi:hypothetical protein
MPSKYPYNDNIYKKMKKSYKGIYRPQRPNKYIGNPNQIVYRSLLERRFMVYCDTSDSVTKWSSEELSIIYRNPIDKRIHRYFPDFIVQMNTGKKYMIEIKPLRQTKPPKIPKKKTKAFMRESFEFIKNQAKWGAAKIYCEDNSLEFKVITEKDLGVYS